MKIAFTSCFSTYAYRLHQPVWQTIAAQNPDVLVLLGDSIYIDVPNLPDIRTSSDDYFAEYVLRLYQQQLAIPEFAQLIAKPNLATYAIWDDHDFLWNDAGANVSMQLAHRGKAVLSNNLLGCWRDALNGTALPTAKNDDRIFSTNYAANLSMDAYNKAMTGYQCVTLQQDKLVLHLTDGRSWRAGKSLLGDVQRKQLELAFAAQDKAVHLVASGSTYGKGGVNGWAGFPADYGWLQQQAGTYKILILSGDVHHNAMPTPIQCGAQKLYEVTASGAAIHFSPFHVDDTPSHFFDYSEKFGLLDVQRGGIDVSLFDHGIKTTLRIPANFN